MGAVVENSALQTSLLAALQHRAAHGAAAVDCQWPAAIQSLQLPPQKVDLSERWQHDSQGSSSSSSSSEGHAQPVGAAAAGNELATLHLQVSALLAQGSVESHVTHW
jgi:hypothetical protein